MSKLPKKTNTLFKHLGTYGNVTYFEHTGNGLRVIHSPFTGTGVITTNIVYRVGSRDEKTGETGLAHMLEHMLFKPTKQDLERQSEAAAMRFDREVGAILNANTWKDRTCYYFSYPKEHLARALTIEAERMRDVVLTDTEFLPERGNVLSEFDMYNSRPDFALSLSLCATALLNHPYRHETIGWREDIEDYTPEKLDAFYKKHYCPNNATLMILGDITQTEALEAAETHFGHLTSATAPVRSYAREPKQYGVRRVVVERSGTENLLGFALKHAGFPSTEWYNASFSLALLANGRESLLHKLLIDTGLASHISGGTEPTQDPNIALLSISLAPKIAHEVIEKKVLSYIASLDKKTITPYIEPLRQKMIVDDIYARDGSLNLAHQLTELVAADALAEYGHIKERLAHITPDIVIKTLQQLFALDQLTIGYYRSL